MSRCFVNVDSNPRCLVESLGSKLRVTQVREIRRDGSVTELALFTGEQGGALPFKLADNFEIRFTGKALDDYNGDAVVLHSGFAWRPVEQVYKGKPSFNTQQLRAMFCGATGGYRYGAAHTVTVNDANRFVGIDSVATVAATFPAPSDFASGAKVWLIANSGTVTITAGAGCTITDPDGLGTALAVGGMVLLTRVNATTWKLSDPGLGELKTVTLMGEFTWRELADPENWTSTETFELVVINDVNRGPEGAPTDAGAPTQYVLRSELSTGLVRADVAQSLDEESKARARNNIGAVNASGVVTVAAQSLTPEQQAQVLTNIGAASQEDLDAANSTAAALAVTVAGKASGSSVTSLGATVTALDGVVLKKTVQVFSDAERAVILSNIGALPAGTQRTFTRLAASFNPIGNSTTVHLNGAIATNVGTATARNVTVLDAGHSISTYTGSTITSAAHGGVDGQACQFTASLFPTGLAALQWYYLRDVTTNTLAVSLTPGGAAISLSGPATSLKVLLAVAPYYHQRRIGYVSAASAGASCGTRHSALQWAVSEDPAFGLWTFQARFGISDAAAVANARMFVGLTGVVSGGVLPNANPSAQLNLIGVGADTGDTTFRIIHNDNAGTATRIDLGADFPCNTRNTDAYELLLTCNEDLTVTYRVINLTTGEVATANLSTDLPMKLQLLAPQLWRNNGGTALAAGLDVIQWKMEYAQ